MAVSEIRLLDKFRANNIPLSYYKSDKVITANLQGQLFV